MTRNHPDFLIAKVGFLYETAKLFPIFFLRTGFFIGISHYLINNSPTFTF